MTSDTPRTDERWETVERFMIAAFPTTLPGWQDTDAALKALRRQLEQTKKARDGATESLRKANETAHVLEGQVADAEAERDALRAEVERLRRYPDDDTHTHAYENGLRVGRAEIERLTDTVAEQRELLNDQAAKADERWERDTPKVVVRMSRAMDALRTQLEQTERERDTLREERNLALAYGKQVENERDAYAALRDHHADLAEWRKANGKPLTDPCGICGRALTPQEDRSPLEDVSEAKNAYPGIFGTTQEDR